MTAIQVGDDDLYGERSAGEAALAADTKIAAGPRPVVELTEIELQQFLNEHVVAGASRSKLSKRLLYLRNILDHAPMKKIIPSNPARNLGYKLKVKSRKAVSQRYLSIEKCRQLMAALDGSYRLIFRILIQLGLRPEELFALRADDVVADTLRIDEASWKVRRPL